MRTKAKGLDLRLPALLLCGALAAVSSVALTHKSANKRIEPRPAPQLPFAGKTIPRESSTDPNSEPVRKEAPPPVRKDEMTLQTNRTFSD